MKKILVTILAIIIWLSVNILLFILTFNFHFAFVFAGAFSGIVSTLFAVLFYDVFKNKTFKNPFKRLWFWLRYKRVKEIKMKSCYGCIFDNIGCGYSAFKCWNSNTIVTKRSYNPLNWLKKLFGILVIALLFASCSVYVNCNFNKVPKYKTTQQDSTVLMINEYWF